MATINDAQMISDSIVQSIDPLSVILFGSVARDGSGEDIDLLIVLDDNFCLDDPDMAVRNSIKNYYKRFSIDPFVITHSVLNKQFTSGSQLLNVICREGKTLYMKNSVKEWLNQSLEEVKTADYLLQGKFFKSACFHAQQSIEKYFKARLLEKGWELEKTHNIERLMALAEEFKITIKLSEEDLVFIDGIYRGRYPGEAGLLPLKDPTEKDARRAVEIASMLCGTNPQNGDLNK